ncbi:hypothetical protein C8R41DRAFT_806719 [Lentinula lateritia]|uniref:Secreted protein n=1 Tax=Lentinula lateritia TaxID=40482 RepID=A0ABQ8VY27_9AGAR|nr:hypothetical protein C8R41DRAFT_806719 [Lentinula lateritia]
MHLDLGCSVLSLFITTSVATITEPIPVCSYWFLLHWPQSQSPTVTVITMHWNLGCSMLSCFCRTSHQCWQRLDNSESGPNDSAYISLFPNAHSMQIVQIPLSRVLPVSPTMIHLGSTSTEPNTWPGNVST